MKIDEWLKQVKKVEARMEKLRREIDETRESLNANMSWTAPSLQDDGERSNGAARASVGSNGELNLRNGYMPIPVEDAKDLTRWLVSIYGEEKT